MVISDYLKPALSYIKTVWKNYASGGTALGETNLNNIENGIGNLVERSNMQDTQLNELTEAVNDQEKSITKAQSTADEAKTAWDSITPALQVKRYQTSEWSVNANSYAQVSFPFTAPEGYTALGIVAVLFGSANAAAGVRAFNLQTSGARVIVYSTSTTGIASGSTVLAVDVLFAKAAIVA